MITPLYRKLRAEVYRSLINIREIRVFDCRALAIRSLVSRRASPYPKSPEIILYTDAGALTNTIPAVLFEPSTFFKRSGILISQTASVPIDWHIAIGPTNLIGGMEMPSAVAFIAERGARLAGRSVASYVDNKCALAALVKGARNPKF